MKNKRDNITKRIFKRTLDISISLLGIILLSPLLIILFCVNSCFTKGHPIFKQKRIGRYGKPFYIYKFRSLVSGTPNCATADLDIDTYYTLFGKVLRKTSLDELPQLWNILKGDMSLIGPRPIIPDEWLLNYRRRLWNVDEIRPGLTGAAQVMGRDDCSDDDKLYWDRWYVNNWSFKEDLKIMLKTVKIIITMSHNSG
jgi:O-antigen biosynthesis protein WbqP